ncbi:MAG: RidA family protein [Desulfobacterales bacterium]|nr:RidA family protein [Desulfobacterales bacterium]MDP6683512.1 RidA family protein [Desulfobacterales bacterium]MDP6807338.1 RidA family protein [Desulfobacterales bacterium]
MKGKTIQTDKAPAAIGPYSQGIKLGSLLFVSGQIGMHPETGELVSPDFAPQVRQTLENLLHVVKAAGGDLDQVVAVDVYLTDMGKFVEFNGIYQEYFAEHRPARAVIEVCALPKGARVEIKCIAGM